MTVATVAYYTGLHPYTLRPVYTAKSAKEKKQRHMFFFWHKRENYQEIKQKLKDMDREDLIEKLLEDKKRFAKQETVKARVVERKTGKKPRKARR